MDEGQKRFEKRQRDLQRKHRALAKGYVTRVGRNGVIEHHPRRDMGGLLTVPAIIFVAAFFGFKILLLLNLGSDTYDAHLVALSSGGLPEKIGALVMTPDPLTVVVSEFLSRLL